MNPFFLHFWTFLTTRHWAWGFLTLFHRWTSCNIGASIGFTIVVLLLHAMPVPKKESTRLLIERIGLTLSYIAFWVTFSCTLLFWIFYCTYLDMIQPEKIQIGLDIHFLVHLLPF